MYWNTIPILSGGCLELDLNIDGIPLYTSKQKQFWPILGQIKNLPNSGPFVIGIFCGYKKPTSVDKYLEDVISDIKTINRNGL